MSDLGRAGLPTRAVIHSTGLYFALRQIAPGELRDAIMQQTVNRISAPDAYVHIPPEDMGKAAPDTAPAGVIFHVGRCGSTVLSQGLKQHGDVVVYSEPLPVNEILSSAASRTEIVAALRSLGAAFAAHAERRYILKLSSWSTLYSEVVTEAFPGAPWVFSVRDPIEVGETIVRDPPPWFQGDTEAARRIAGLVDPNGEAQSREEFFARLYSAFCEAINRLDLKQGQLVPYQAQPGALTEIVAPHFGLSIDEGQKRRMLGSAAHYAKAPVSLPRAFVADSAAKQGAASAELRRWVGVIAQPSLEALSRAFASR